MSNDKVNISTPPYNLASLIRGLYGRVARQLKVDPSYVSRVARGERQSDAIEASLEKELRRIMSLVKFNRNGANHNGANHNGSGRSTTRGAKKVAVTKRKKKVLH
jgi:hypothetical protein